MFSLPISSARAFTRFWFSRSIAPALVQTKHAVVENTTSAPRPARQASMAPPGMPSRSPRMMIFFPSSMLYHLPSRSEYTSGRLQPTASTFFLLPVLHPHQGGTSVTPQRAATPR